MCPKNIDLSPVLQKMSPSFNAHETHALVPISDRGKYLPQLAKHFRQVMAFDLSPKLVAIAQKEARRFVRDVRGVGHGWALGKG